VLAAAVAVVLVVTDPFSGGGATNGGLTDNAYATSTQTVVRQSISQQTQVSATLGYAGNLTIRLPAGNAPAAVTQAQEALTSAQGTFAGAESALSSDSSALSVARATLTADRTQESIDCAGNNSAQAASGGNGSGSNGASGGCASDAQLVSGGQQAFAGDAAKVSADQSQVTSAEHALAQARSALSAASAGATVRRITPLLIFLGSVIALAELTAEADVFDVLARRVAVLGRGHFPVLAWLCIALAAVTTAALNLDTTVVLLTPVMLALAARLEVPPLPFAATNSLVSCTGFGQPATTLSAPADQS